MRVVPQSDYTYSPDVIFRNRVIYDVIEISGTNYVLDFGGVHYIVPISEIWVEVPDNLVLDSRSQFQRMYDDLKQRDVDYIKVYKDRMGIIIFKNYATEQLHRFKTRVLSTDVGLPEGHSLQN